MYFSLYPAEITVGFQFLSYTVREGGDRTMVCAERLQGTVNRELILEMTVIPEDVSEGNASGEEHTLLTNKQDA